MGTELGTAKLVLDVLILTPGVTKTYKLTYESIKVEHALFNRDAARNRWKLGANVLRSFIEYFGAGTEQLDLYIEDGRLTFTSYTEKVTSGKGLVVFLIHSRGC